MGWRLVGLRGAMRQRKGRKKIGPLEIFLLLLLAVQLYLQITHDPNEGKFRELRQMQTWQAQPVPTWWAETQTAFWTWKTPTPGATLTLTHTPTAPPLHTPTPVLRASPPAGKAPEPGRGPTVTRIEQGAEEVD
jgi:hypothetical protein